MRTAGEILLEMEPLLEELVDAQELQYSDVLYLILGWLDVHRPGAKEQYLDGSSPEFYYGPRRELRSEKKKRRSVG
jgi:hypothetical protein